MTSYPIVLPASLSDSVSLANAGYSFRSGHRPSGSPYVVERNTSSVRPLGSTGITRRHHYYGPRRLPMRPPDGYGFPPSVELGLATPGLPGSWLICRHPPSPTTPRDRDVAYTRCFTSRVGFAISGRLAIPDTRNEAESGSHFRITAGVFASEGFDGWITPRRRPVSYTANEHLPCLIPFNQIEQPDLAWHTRGAETRRLNRGISNKEYPSQKSRRWKIDVPLYRSLVSSSFTPLCVSAPLREIPFGFKTGEFPPTESGVPVST